MTQREAQLPYTESDIKVVRKPNLAEKIVIVDGLPGCGKSMLSAIVASFNRVELLTFAYEIEYICTLYYLRKITTDAAITMIRMLTDLRLYHTMMARETNFRPSDVSSVFRNPNRIRYLLRLFQKGDEAVPKKISSKKPILHLTTHHILALSEPIFSALEKRVAFIEVVRHPLYMIKQQTINMETLLSNVRDFDFYLSYKDKQLPYYAFGWEDLFLNSNPVEKSIYFIEKLTKRAETAKKKLNEVFKAQILTIPFESFVINPWPYIKKIEHLLETKTIKITHKMMKKQNVPRKMYADGIGLKIYKRCGWEPPRPGTDETKEFEIRRQFVAKRASKKAMEIFDQLCKNYEKKYLND